ncbi:MAG: hypothetical protein IJ525_06025 [Alphaproteobacteria bacterium]|nr:hypothetical protein [Alphaproteobacteria bacterium]
MRNLEIKNNASLAPCGRERQSGRCLLPESGADAPTVLSAVYTDSTPAKNRQADVPQYGRSMIEMLGVLAIIGVLSVGGIAGYSKAMMKYRINKTIEQITLIAGNVRAFFAPQRNYDGLSSYSDTGKAIIKKAKLVPDEVINGSRYQGAFGDIFIESALNKKGQDYAFSLKFASIPQEACIELLTMDWGSVASGFLGIARGEPGWLHGAYEELENSGDNPTYVALVGGTQIGIPFPMEKAINACKKDNSLSFLFE